MLCIFLFVSSLQELRGSVLVTHTLPILGVRIHSVCLACISMTFEPTHVDYVSRCGTYFGTVGHACATKCVKCEKEGKVHVLR